MFSDNAIRHQRLRQAIKAVKSGNRARGRVLLLQVVQEDPGIEQAWWWLAQIVEHPQEKLRTLENVLRINPLHREAQERILRLRQQKLATVESGSSVDWERLFPTVPVDAADGLEDPYQCPYCGQPTRIDDQKCRVCKGHLYWRVAKSRSSNALRSVIFFLSLLVSLGLLELVGALFGLALVQDRTLPRALQLLLQFPAVRSVIGEFSALSPVWGQVLIGAHMVRVAALLLLIMGLRARWTIAYYATIFGLVADLLLNLFLLTTTLLGPVGGMANLLFDLLVLVSMAAVNYEFAVNWERLLVRPDGGAHSATDYYDRGHAYRKQGMWALAVAQWRKAVGLAPGVASYYKDLGIGYAQIRRYDRSLRALEEALRHSPSDRHLPELINLVKGRAETERSLRR